LKGIYVLIIELDENVDINVGALGALRLAKGFYAYVGSAQTNFAKRIGRHLGKEKRKFWHIDYVLDHPASKIVRIFAVNADKNHECKIARRISEKGNGISGFGCSDCNCRSHLVKLGSC